MSNDSRFEVVQVDRDSGFLEFTMRGYLPKERKTKEPIEELCLFV
jgi:hypothetical protein